jgi:hypothetical protein
VLLVSFGGSCILGIFIAFCYSAFGTFFGCARLCNCLCPIMGFLIYNTLLIKKIYILC